MPRRILQGVVTSSKMDKTVTVQVERRLAHPKYGKIIRLSKKYHAHDEQNAAKEGDVVRIIECAPMSKTKSWRVVSAEEAQSAKAEDAARRNQKATSIAKEPAKAAKTAKSKKA
jgi:small subunit ribosomal protein S17